MARGPGRPVELDEAAALAESALSTDYQELRVLSVAELEAGWAFALHTPRYIQTRSARDALVGAGLTFVERATGDVYSSDSAHAPEVTVRSFARALADGTGPAQVPYKERPRVAFDVYYDRLLRGANDEADRTARDRFWLHVLDALRLRRMVLSNSSLEDLRRAVLVVHNALDEFPPIGQFGARTRIAFDAFEDSVNRAG
jgi:hypothetical protein